MQDISDFFIVLHDPRVDRTKKHSLSKIITLSIYAIIAGANTWLDIEEICELREEELAQMIDLENGIPSHDTFQRVFAKLDPKELSNVLATWMQALLGSVEQKHIAIDGKTVRRSFDNANKKSAIHTLNAFVVDSLTILRHEVGEGKGNEIKMIKDMLKCLDIKNSVITIDAIGCQKDITEQIRRKKADYLIALKGNQPNLYSEIKEYFEHATTASLDEKCFSSYQSIDKGHGRIETRSCLCLDTTFFPLNFSKDFKDIKTIVRVNSIVDTSNARTAESRYFITSLDCDASKIATIVRGHWAIENSLHYVLDVIYLEDDNRTRKDHSPANFSLLRKIALSLINLHKDKKVTQKGARLRAMMKHSYARFMLLGTEVKEI